MDRYYLENEFKKRFLKNANVSKLKLNKFLTNINYLCKYLDKSWIERIYGGASGIAVAELLSYYGFIIRNIYRVRRFKILIKKIKNSRSQNESILYFNEISIMSKFVDNGASVCYEPEILRNGVRKYPDFKFKIKKDWIYVEICNPYNTSWPYLGKLSNSIYQYLKISKEFSLYILIERKLNKDEVAMIQKESKKLINTFKKGSSSQKVGNFALLVTDDTNPRIISRNIKIPRNIPTVSMCQLRPIKRNKIKIQKINIQIVMNDQRANESLNKESRHFSKRTKNIIIFNLTSMPGSLKNWNNLLNRRMQSNVHKRINGVGLIECKALGDKKTRNKVRFIARQNAYKKLNKRELNYILKTLKSN